MSIKPRTATVVIYQGDDLERLSELRRKADTAERIQRENADSARIGDGDDGGVAELKAAYDAFVEEAAERAEVVTLRAIGRGRWRDLLADHAAREVDGEMHPDDALYGCNTETLPDALLTFVDGDVRTIESPEFSTSKARQDFLDNDLSAGDFESLWVTAYWLNVSPGADPKASRYSLDTPNSSETSMLPDRLG